MKSEELSTNRRKLSHKWTQMISHMGSNICLHLCFSICVHLWIIRFTLFANKNQDYDNKG